MCNLCLVKRMSVVLCFKYVGMEKSRREREKQEVTVLQEDLSSYIERCICFFCLQILSELLCLLSAEEERGKGAGIGGRRRSQ